MVNAERLLEVHDLKTYFDTDAGPLKAVDGVSFHLDRGETLAVTERGRAKRVTRACVDLSCRSHCEIPGCGPGRGRGIAWVNTALSRYPNG